jgi:prepilin-type N-terminal cleavage/methylation domain-containing protein
MTTPTATWLRARNAFTLIELLVVIAIIGILAALIFPAAGAIKKRAIITKVQTELDQVIVAIDIYKEKIGTFPPDNPGQPALNQLYYELLGTVLTNSNYETLDKAARIPVGAASFARAFSGVDANNNPVPSTVSGFVNCTRGGGEEVLPAKSFLRSLKPGQYVAGVNNSIAIRLLTCSVQWPKNLPAVVSTFTPDDRSVNPNPWRYNSSNPTNSPGSYDLWVDVMIGGKTNRISNWRKQPLPVGAP